MTYLLRYLPILDKENAGPRLIIFSLLLLSLSILLFISNLIFLFDPTTPTIINTINFSVWGVIFFGFLYSKTEEKMHYATVVILTMSSISLFYSLYFTGGIYSVDIAWTMLIILVAYLFSGITSGISFTVFSLLGIFFYYYTETINYWEAHLNEVLNEPNYAFSTLASIIVALSVILFAFVKTLNTLQKKNKELTENKLDELSMMLDARSREIETLRNKLARDFHDQTGNKLVSLKMLASQLKNQTEIHTPELTKQLSLIEKNANELYNHNRDFIWSIDSRNSSLDEIILHLADFGNTFFEPLNITFETKSKLSELREHIIPIEHVMQLILIFKEGMTNSMKYSGCKAIVLSCTIENNQCILLLNDNGIGFDKNKEMRKNGLKNIEERGLAIGATIEILSQLNKGTSVKVVYPLSKHQDKKLYGKQSNSNTNY